MVSDRDDDGSASFEHTADLGLRVWAVSMEGLFEQAAAGLASLMFDAATVRPAQTVPLVAEGEEPEELLVAWLNEVIFAQEVGGFTPVSARVTSMADGRIEGELSGEPFDPGRHEQRHSIKAVTFHDLQITETDGRYEVSIVLDV